MAPGKEKDAWEYSLRKYLLLLATLVATVTYAAGFSPPGGVWQDGDSGSGRLAGDPIIRDTSYHRYLAFFYCNATAFALSLVVIVLILILSILHERTERSLAPLRILRVVMVLDLLSLMGAYAAGTCRDTLTAVYSLVLVSVVVVYLVVQMALALSAEKENRDLERRRKVLMLLATFAVSLTYLAGLSAPGGFWDHDEGGHRPGVAVLQGRHDARLKVFFISNTTSFIASLLIILLLQDKKLSESSTVRSWQLYGFIVVALIGLVVAYTAGSTRQTDTTVYVSALVGAVLACILLQVVIVRCFGEAKKKSWNNSSSTGQENQDPESRNDGTGSDEQQQTQKQRPDNLEKARSLVLLLATLAATITYQAGLNPPGGLWQLAGDGYMVGDPILLTTNPRRYKAFFYCNSVAFVASLVAIILVQKSVLVKYHALEAAMILDLFGLIGAYAAGSCRDVSTSIYAMALAGAVLVYVVIHVVFFTLDHEDSSATDDGKLVENRRKRLLLFAILAATITYQAGLTPPSGFRTQGDESGHRAGDPVLLYNFPRRYTAFFYCNSVSFMLSIALIILLVNRNLYRPAIRSNALSVCTAAGMCGLVGAYAAGSTQHLKTSIYIFALAAVILFFVALLVLAFLLNHKETKEAKEKEEENKKKKEAEKKEQKDQEERKKEEMEEGDKKEEEREEGGKKEEMEEEDKREEDKARSNPSMECHGDVETSVSTEDPGVDKKLHSKRKYLMLLGILVASVTYQAGLVPPGGVWPDGVTAGDPVMHDNRRPRYLAFFYSNSTSFVASIVVIILLLPEWLHKEKWWLGVMKTTILLDLLGLLIAYAAGSSRSWKTSAYVSALVLAVLAYFVIHVALSCFMNREDQKGAPKDVPPAAASPSNREDKKPAGADVAPAPASPSNRHVQPTS